MFCLYHRTHEDQFCYKALLRIRPGHGLGAIKWRFGLLLELHKEQAQVEEGAEKEPANEDSLSAVHRETGHCLG